MKEYRQNAAEAGASKIHFVFDNRLTAPSRGPPSARWLRLDEVQDKVLWLPCVATGVMKTNISAKMMTLVSDKRREGHAELDRAETNVDVYGRDYAREPRRSTQAAPGERCLNEPRTALRKHKLGDWNFQVLQPPS